MRPGIHHFNTGSIGATPLAVREAHKAYLDRMEENPFAYAWSGFEDATYNQAQRAVSSFIGANSDEVYLTRNTTEAMNLIAGGLRQAGRHQLTWNAPDRATGTYFYRVRAGADQEIRKMLLLK